MQKEIDEFLEVKSGYLTPRSVTTYKRSLAVFTEIVDKPLEEIRDRDIALLVSDLQKRYKDTTVQNIMNTVHTFFKFWAPERDCLNHERIHVPRALAMPRYAATHEDYEAMKTVIDTSSGRGLQQLLTVQMLWCTGMRVGELVSLRLDQIDLKSMKATVKTEKTMAFREVFWDLETHLTLLQYLRIRKKLRETPYLMVCLHSWGPQPNGHLSTRAVERWFKELLKEAICNPAIVPHSFRHSRIQRWFRSGLNAYDIIMLTGHRSVVSLTHYMRLNHPQNEANARKALAEHCPLKMAA